MRKNVSEMDFATGEVLLVDKPKGWTSFDVVGKIRNTIKVKKVGHAGTLDPLATGLLVVCTGKSTKTIQGIQDADKEYITEFRLGATTASFDAEQPAENEKDCSHLREEDIRNAMPAFVGNIEQMPPVFSAIKVNGKRAYEAARAGKEIELKPRPVQIYAFELISFTPPDRAVARIHCGKGTYIRSLIHDLGQALGVGAYILELRRTRIGSHLVENAWEIDQFCQAVKARKETTAAQDNPSA